MSDVRLLILLVWNGLSVLIWSAFPHIIVIRPRLFGLRFLFCVACVSRRRLGYIFAPIGA